MSDKGATVLSLVFYILGSWCFLLGSAITLWRTLR